jgi:hypothetical protein
MLDTVREYEGRNYFGGSTAISTNVARTRERRVHSKKASRKTVKKKELGM